MIDKGQEDPVIPTKMTKFKNRPYCDSCLFSRICVNFRKETGLLFSQRVKIGLRKQKHFLRKVLLPQESEKGENYDEQFQ